MKAADLPAALALVALMAESSAAAAFGFCFSFGGSSYNRSDYYRGPPPSMVYGPGIYQAYPYSPVLAGPYNGGAYYLPPPMAPQYDRIPAEPAETR